MIFLLKRVWLISALLLASVNAHSAVSPEVATAVQGGLDGGASHAQIIGTLTADPMNMGLEEAALAAMEAGGEENRDAFATAAIAAAANLPEAESLATAVAAAGASSASVDAAMAQYVKLMDQPYIHHDGIDPSGGGAYNPQGPGGGTRPPIGPRPPVSPAS